MVGLLGGVGGFSTKLRPQQLDFKQNASELTRRDVGLEATVGFNPGFIGCFLVSHPKMLDLHFG